MSEDRFERREKTEKIENHFKKLERLLQEVANEINQEHPELVDKDGRIVMDAFKNFDIAEDKKGVLNKEECWLELFKNNAVKNFFMQQYHLNPEDPDAEINLKNRYLDDQKKHDGPVWEMAKTCLFHKILKSKFLVVRASKHDDYTNGVDNIVVDKETGAVVCAFDEVRAGGGREEDKQKKWDKASKAGVQIKYGVTFEQGNLIKKSFKNIPTFILAISQEELGHLLKEMSYNLEEKSEKEINIFKELIRSLDEQVKVLQSKGAKQELIDGLENFQNSLEKIITVN